MRNIAIRLRYDGSEYHGWQVQKNDVSVAETLERALGKVCGHAVKLTGCGRTDAGVHALREFQNGELHPRGAPAPCGEQPPARGHSSAPRDRRAGGF